MEPLSKLRQQKFEQGIALNTTGLIPSNVKYKLWSRLFWLLVTAVSTGFLTYQAITQPIWPNLEIVRQNWPSSLLLLILILGWYSAIGYLVYWTFARAVLLSKQRHEWFARSANFCHYGMLLTDEGVAIRLPRRPWGEKCELFLGNTAVTAASRFFKRDGGNVGHWHLRISYINNQNAETSIAFPYDEFQCILVEDLVEAIEVWLI